MSKQTWQETLIVSVSDGAAVTNTTTPTTILAREAQLVVPAGYFYVGRMFKITAHGRISCASAATILFTLRNVSGTTGGTQLTASPTYTLNATAKTNVTFEIELLVSCRAIGASGNFLPIGHFRSEAVTGAAVNVVAEQFWPLSAPGSFTLDTTVAQSFDLYAQWGAASASNSIQTHLYKVESLN